MHKRSTWVAFGACVLLTGCNSFGQSGAGGDRVYDAVSSLDLSAKRSYTIPDANLGGQGRARGVTFVASASDSSPARGGREAETGAYEIEFENAPVAAVAKSIISDTLQLGLTVDPRVTGTISLSSGRPLSRSDLLFALEGALRTANAALVKEGAGYRLAPAGEVGGLAKYDGAGAATPGHGVSVFPLRHVSAENMLKIVDGFTARQGAIRIDAARNLLVIVGSGEERRLALETIGAFDQDWMRGQSVGIYPVASAAPETIISELQKIMDAGEGGAYRGVLQFQPIVRMNAVLAISRNPNALRTAATWIQRLDRSSNAASQSRVYRVKYGNARQLAALLNEALGEGKSSLTGAADQSQARGLGGAASQDASASGASAMSGSDAASPFGSLIARPGGRSANAGGATQSAAPAGRGDGPTASGARGPGFSVSADTTTNSLLIFADRERFQMIERVLRELDRPRMQVSIEATIAEVTLNDGLDYGVQYFLKSADIGSMRPDRGSLGFTAGTSAVLGRVLPGANFLLGPQADPRAILSALSTRTDVKVLSSPSVVVLDNQVASIQVGDQVPVASTQATLVGITQNASGSAFPVANNIDYRNTGVILRVLPRVSNNGAVMLEIEQEISNVVRNGAQNSLTPTVSQRQIRSAIAVTSGQTVVLGGLISDRQSKDRSGVPVLSNIALLGDLFARNESLRNRTELIVFIKPQIIMDSVDAQIVAEEMRSRMLNARVRN